MTPKVTRHSLTLPSKDEKKDCFAFEESKEKRVTKGYAIGCALDVGNNPKGAKSNKGGSP